MSRVTHSKTFYLVLIIILIIILGFFVLPKYLPGITIGDKGGVYSSSTTPDTKTEENHKARVLGEVYDFGCSPVAEVNVLEHGGKYPQTLESF